MPLRHPFEDPPAETPPNAQTAASEKNRDAVGRAEALREAQTMDALDYIQRYDRFSREVERLKLGDCLACTLFPLAAWVLGLLLLFQGLFWLTELTGAGHLMSLRGSTTFLILGVVGTTATAGWLASRETASRRREQPERIQEIARRHGVDPARPRME